MIALKIGAKVKEKLTCAFKNNIRNLENVYRLKNSDFVLVSKMTKLNMQLQMQCELDELDAL